MNAMNECLIFIDTANQHSSRDLGTILYDSRASDTVGHVIDRVSQFVKDRDSISISLAVAKVVAGRVGHSSGLGSSVPRP